jgi:hypothetical protein
MAAVGAGSAYAVSFLPYLYLLGLITPHRRTLWLSNESTTTNILTSFVSVHLPTIGIII